METNIREHDTEQGGKFFTLFVDDEEYRTDKESLTGGDIMDLASIPRNVGVVLIEEDGTQRQIGADEVIDLKPGRRLKRAPRFKRG